MIENQLKAKDKNLKKCDFCEKKFTDKSTLTKHLLIHTGVKAFECDFCEKKFTQKGSLYRHLTIHTGEKTYQCSLCEKKFMYKWGLTSHLTMHAGQKAFKCDVCEKEFTQKGNARSHFKQFHSGVQEPPAVCHVCGKRFNRGKRNRNEHLRVVHGITQAMMRQMNPALVNL